MVPCGFSRRQEVIPNHRSPSTIPQTVATRLCHRHNRTLPPPTLNHLASTAFLHLLIHCSLAIRWSPSLTLRPARIRWSAQLCPVWPSSRSRGSRVPPVREAPRSRCWPALLPLVRTPPPVLVGISERNKPRDLNPRRLSFTSTNLPMNREAKPGVSPSWGTLTISFWCNNSYTCNYNSCNSSNGSCLRNSQT